MSGKAWAIKLGSGGACVSFCEERGIVGIGWSGMDKNVLDQGTYDQVRAEVDRAFPNQTVRKLSSDTGQIYRFWKECTVGDYILYYDPTTKSVRICGVTSEAKYRDFDIGNPTDIWIYREVKFSTAPISILDLYGGLKGSLLGPRSSFWSLNFAMVNEIAHGNDPGKVQASDVEVTNAYKTLRNLIKKRMEVLQDRDWELLVADYFKLQGADVDESRIGKNIAVIDLEASFSMGEFSAPDVWRIQVKRYQDRSVDWNEVLYYFNNAHTENFCFVSAFGFTPEAIVKAEELGIRLLQAEDFITLVLSGQLRSNLKAKLNIQIPKAA